MDITLLITLFVVGVGVSAFGNMIGFGGGVFLIPILTSFFDMSVHQAVAISLLSIFPAALIATIRNLKMRMVDILAGTALEVPTAVGTIIGSIVCISTPSLYLRFMFAVMVFWMAVRMILGAKKEGKNSIGILEKLNRFPPVIVRHRKGFIYKISLTLSAIVGIGVGIIAGLLGVGGGFMKTPLMVLVFDMPSDVAIATSLFMITFTSAVGSLTHFYLEGMSSTLFAVMPISFAIGSLINVRFFRIRREKLRYVIAAGLIISGLIIILH